MTNSLMTISSVPDSGVSSAVKAGIYVSVVVLMAAAAAAAVIYSLNLLRSSMKGKYYLQIT